MIPLWLGELEEKLRALPATQPLPTPLALISWRGNYAEAALTPGDIETCGALADRIAAAITSNECFDGYKGGSYIFDGTTYVYLTPDRRSSRGVAPWMLAFLELIHGAELGRAVPAEPPAKPQSLTVTEAIAELDDLVERLEAPAEIQPFDVARDVERAELVERLERRVERLRARLRGLRDVAELTERRLHTVLEEYELTQCEACAAAVPSDEIRTVGDDSVPLCSDCFEAEEVTP